jgi:hypothetical protein
MGSKESSKQNLKQQAKPGPPPGGEKAMAEVENEMRARFGDEFVCSLKRITKQRDDFKTDLINAIESGKSGPASLGSQNVPEH